MRGILLECRHLAEVLYSNTGMCLVQFDLKLLNPPEIPAIPSSEPGKGCSYYLILIKALDAVLEAVSGAQRGAEDPGVQSTGPPGITCGWWDGPGSVDGFGSSA